MKGLAVWGRRAHGEPGRLSESNVQHWQVYILHRNKEAATILEQRTSISAAVQEASECWNSNICTLSPPVICLNCSSARKMCLQFPGHIYFSTYTIAHQSALSKQHAILKASLPFVPCLAVNVSWRNNQCPNNRSGPFKWARWFDTVWETWWAELSLKKKGEKSCVTLFKG